MHKEIAYQKHLGNKKWKKGEKEAKNLLSSPVKHHIGLCLGTIKSWDLENILISWRNKNIYYRKGISRHFGTGTVFSDFYWSTTSNNLEYILSTMIYTNELSHSPVFLIHVFSYVSRDDSLFDHTQQQYYIIIRKWIGKAE